jgi:two-component system, NtrC family, sensor kinase
LDNITTSTLHLLQLRARKDNIRLIMNFPESPIMIVANETELRQIIINLVLNAMAASDCGSAIVVKGFIETLPDGSICPCLAIRDHGKGIPAEQMPFLFKPFYTTKLTGTGLGLSIVKRITDRNAWKLDVASAPEVGTTFTLWFFDRSANA